MFGRTVAVLVLAASCVVTGIGPAMAISKAGPAASENGPWYQTDSGAARSRANLNEHVLAPSAVAKVKFLRSMTSPPTPPGAQCAPESIVAPALVGGYVYAITNLVLSKYDAATGKLIWRRIPDPTFFTYYESLSVSGNGLVVVGGTRCDSGSDPGSTFAVYNASTGKLVWSADLSGGFTQEVVSQGYVATGGVNASGYSFDVLNLSNGKTVWQTFTSCQPSTWTPLVVSSLAITHGCDSHGNTTLEARNLRTGTLVWSLPGRWAFQRGDFSGKQLFATNPAGAVVALDPLTGKVEYTLSHAVSVLAVDNSRAYATCGSEGQYVCAYNVSTGTLEWQDTKLLSRPALAAEADGVLYLDSGLALKAATGHVIKKLAVGGFKPQATALVVGDGRIAAVSHPRVLDLFGLSGY
jgi:outer membrane protein assembly factor BamB